MEQSKIELLNGEKISLEVLEAIEESECVSNVSCLGLSGMHNNCNWYSVEFDDGSDIDVYVAEVVEDDEIEVNEEKVQELLKMGDVF